MKLLKKAAIIVLSVILFRGPQLNLVDAIKISDEQNLIYLKD